MGGDHETKNMEYRYIILIYAIDYVYMIIYIYVCHIYDKTIKRIDENV